MPMASKALPINLKEENKQGISSILDLTSDGHCEKRVRTEYPLRRTLSADMSSKRFLSQSSLKKVASSEEISMISGTKESGDHAENPRSQFYVWNSIQLQKPSGPDALHPPPYVHPTTKRSSSSLSSKSLEMCTENLGSETGSDICSTENSPSWLTFSPPPSSTHPLPSSVPTDERREERNFFKFERKEYHTEKSVNYNCAVSRRSPPRSFPPPLPSLSSRDGGPCIHMKPRRQDGRLVLEAVAAPSHNYLHAERQGGRLLLSFISTGEQVVEGDKITSNEKEEEIDQVVEKGGVEEEDHEIVGVDGNEVNDEEEAPTDQKDLSSVKRGGLEVVGLEKWKNNGPSSPVTKLIISQPFANINPWAQKKSMVEFEDETHSSAAVGRANSFSGGCFNLHECSWKEADRKVVAGKEEAGRRSLLLSQDLGGVLAAAPTSRCHTLPRRTQHLWIMERYCIATT